MVKCSKSTYRYPRRPKEGISSSRAGFVCGCNPPVIGNVKQNWVLCKNCMCSELLSYLSFYLYFTFETRSYVAETSLVLQIFLPSPPKGCDYRNGPVCSVLGDQTQGLVHARQVSN